MVLSRASELRRLDELVSGLRAGGGGALVVRGDPGIGKTTLLDALAERAGDGVTVLRARGVETEAELAFAALSDLLGPLADRLDALPAAQAAALAAALALGPPAPGDRLAVCVATLGLLRAAGGPVLLVVDDLQWLDAASRECVLYAARRAGDGLAAALATREDAAGLPELRLGPLDAEASRELLRRSAPGLSGPAVAAVMAAAAGNPLALRELPAALSAEQRAGVAELDAPLPLGGRLHAAFAERIDELDAPARRALTVAAAYAGHDLATLSRACDVGRLVAAEERGLVRLGAAEVHFAHPLIRAAAYHGAGPAERRAAHAALAAALAGERRAWHLAAATVGADEAVAAELQQAGEAAGARRGFAAAAAAFERAARLSPAQDDAVRRLLAAGEAAGAAGLAERAVALLEEAAARAGEPGPSPDLGAPAPGGAGPQPALGPHVHREGAPGWRPDRGWGARLVAAPPQTAAARGPVAPAVRARAQHLRGRLMVWCGAPGQATTLLVAEAEAAAERDPVLAASMLADAANGCTATNDYHRAEALAERAVALLGDRGVSSDRAAVLAMLGWALILRGRTARGRAAMREAEQLAAGLDPLGPHWPWLHLFLRTRIPLGELERARADGLALAERARDAGALATLGSGLIVAADAALRLGDWDTADAATAEAMRVAGGTGQRSWYGYALTTRARLAGARGDEPEAREAAMTALHVAHDGGITTGLRFAYGALGFLELSLERVPEAIERLRAAERQAAGSGHEEPVLVPWAPDLVEAYVRGGCPDDARRVLETVERHASLTGLPFAAAVAARCRGLLEDDFDAPFARALTVHEHTTMPFEHARTRLAYGRRLHRARRRAEAREVLREALAGFESLGAAAWAAQAQNELRAAGARRRTTASGGELTAQEQRVVAAVRRGASNREIATELFLAPKTVEFHLRQIYRKVGVRSRTQLVAALPDEPAHG